MKLRFVIFFYVYWTIRYKATAASTSCVGNECYVAAALTESLLANSDGGTENSTLTLTGVASIATDANGEMHINSSLNMVTVSTASCPTLENADTLSQIELIIRLTHPCRYDRGERPRGSELNNTKYGGPVQVYARTYVYTLQNVNQFQFNMQALLQIRYTDPRLAFGVYAPQRRKPIMGEAQLRDLIWVPHLILANAEDSSVLGTLEKDILTSISPQGEVIIGLRLQATLFCWMEMQKFPFDDQYCSTTLESWMYNASDVVLNWEAQSPVTYNPDMELALYALENSWYNASLLSTAADTMWHGALKGNYSSLTFTAHLVHNAANYIIDYFIPSMIIVAVSWVSFWIRADQTPTRTILCCSTMLSLITLASAQIKDSSGYLKVFEIWFLGCVLFIFGSLIEFAFSNTIWCRKRDVELKKVNSTSILKSTVMPRKTRPKTMHKSSSTISCISYMSESPVVMTNCNALPDDGTDSISNGLTLRIDDNATVYSENLEPPHRTLKTMTPKEVSLWLDRKSRFLFPLAFLIFNVFFWMFVLL